MRIGLATDFYYPWIGGPSAVVRNIGHGLAARGHSLSLLAPSAKGVAERHMDGPVEVWRAQTFPVPFGYNLRTAAPWTRAADHWMDNFRPDVVNVHHPFPLSYSVLSAARRRGIPVVATNHTIPECSLWGLRQAVPVYAAARYAMSRWLRLFLSQADAVTTPTETAARLLLALGFTGQIEAISNGIDAARFHPGSASQDLRRSLGLDDRPIVLYTGRLDAEKQMDVWLQAAAIVATRRQAQFVVGGQGSDRSRLERLAQDLDIGHVVRFIGYLSEEDLPLIYRLADVFFVSSPVELQCLSALEAAASGLPIVGVNAGALPEILRNGENGHLFPPGQSSLAAELLDSVLCDVVGRRRMGEYSRQLALTHGLDETVNKYELLFQNVRKQRLDAAA